MSDKLAALIRDDRIFLLATDIAPILGVDPNSIRRQADVEPQALGFPVTRIGSKTLIPRIPFLRFIGEDFKKGGKVHEAPLAETCRSAAACGRG